MADRPKTGLGRVVCGLSLALTVFATGCQSEYGGQLLPSPYWQTDDVQYFPPGPEFKLSREAAALAAAKRPGSKLRGSKGVLPAPTPVPAPPADATPIPPAAPADPNAPQAEAAPPNP